MSITGFNVDPESCDANVDVELKEDGQTALLYIGEVYGNTEIDLNYSEVCELLSRLHKIRERMEWNSAAWVIADFASLKSHIMRKEDAEKIPEDGTPVNDVRSLCGRQPPYPYHWNLTPVDRPSESCCQSCMKAYHRLK
jgi:hypothetical protein